MVDFVNEKPESPTNCKAGTNRPDSISKIYGSMFKTDKQNLLCYVYEARTPAEACWRAIWAKCRISKSFISYIDGLKKNNDRMRDVVPNIVLPTDIGFPEFVVSLGRFCSCETDGQVDVKNLVDLFWGSCTLRHPQNNLSNLGSSGQAFATFGFADKLNAWIVESDKDNSPAIPRIVEYVNSRPKPISIFFEEDKIRIILINRTTLAPIPVPKWEEVQFTLQSQPELHGRSIFITDHNLSKLECNSIHGLFENSNPDTEGPNPSPKSDIELSKAKMINANTDGYTVEPNNWTIKVISVSRDGEVGVSIFKIRKGCILTTEDNLAVAIRIAALNLALGR